jgi:hypothetical protein
MGSLNAGNGGDIRDNGSMTVKEEVALVAFSDSTPAASGNKNVSGGPTAGETMEAFKNDPSAFSEHNEDFEEETLNADFANGLSDAGSASEGATRPPSVNGFALGVTDIKTASLYCAEASGVGNSTMGSAWTGVGVKPISLSLSSVAGVPAGVSVHAALSAAFEHRPGMASEGLPSSYTTRLPKYDQFSEGILGVIGRVRRNVMSTIMNIKPAAAQKVKQAAVFIMKGLIDRSSGNPLLPGPLPIPEDFNMDFSQRWLFTPVTFRGAMSGPSVILPAQTSWVGNKNRAPVSARRNLQYVTPFVRTSAKIHSDDSARCRGARLLATSAPFPTSLGILSALTSGCLVACIGDIFESRKDNTRTSLLHRVFVFGRVPDPRFPVARAIVDATLAHPSMSIDTHVTTAASLFFEMENEKAANDFSVNQLSPYIHPFSVRFATPPSAPLRSHLRRALAVLAPVLRKFLPRTEAGTALIMREALALQAISHSGSVRSSDALPQRNAHVLNTGSFGAAPSSATVSLVDSLLADTGLALVRASVPHGTNAAVASMMRAPPTNVRKCFGETTELSGTPDVSPIAVVGLPTADPNIVDVVLAEPNGLIHDLVTIPGLANKVPSRVSRTGNAAPCADVSVHFITTLVQAIGSVDLLCGIARTKSSPMARYMRSSRPFILSVTCTCGPTGSDRSEAGSVWSESGYRMDLLGAGAIIHKMMEGSLVAGNSTTMVSNLDERFAMQRFALRKAALTLGLDRSGVRLLEDCAYAEAARRRAAALIAECGTRGYAPLGFEIVRWVPPSIPITEEHEGHDDNSFSPPPDVRCIPLPSWNFPVSVIAGPSNVGYMLAPSLARPTGIHGVFRDLQEYIVTGELLTPLGQHLFHPASVLSFSVSAALLPLDQ